MAMRNFVSALDGLINAQRGRERQLSLPLRSVSGKKGINPRTPKDSKTTEAGKNLDAKTKNLVMGTRIDQQARQKFQELVDRHGMAKVIGTGLLGGAGATGAVLVGRQLLSPEEVEVLAVTDDGRLIMAEPEDDGGSGLVGPGLGALTVAGLLSMDYGQDLPRDIEDEMREMGMDPSPTPFTDEMMTPEQKRQMNSAIDNERSRRRLS